MAPFLQRCDQLMHALERLHLANQLRVLLTPGFLDRLVRGLVDAGDEGRDELVSAHSDVPVDPPHREGDAMTTEGPPPRERMLIVRVDERPVDV